MKYNRSSKIYFTKWLTQKKLAEVHSFLDEYAKAVNYFIEQYESVVPQKKKFDLLRKEAIHDFVGVTGSWLSHRAIKNAFAEAYGMVKSAKSNTKHRKDGKYFRPVHYGKKAILSQTNASISIDTSMKDFDMAVTLGSIGAKKKITIPLRRHKQFNRWYAKGKLTNTITLSRSYVQFSFEIEEAPKKVEGEYVGVDIGIENLIMDSCGHAYGDKYKQLLEKLDRKTQGSKAYKQTKEELKEYIDWTLKNLPWDSYHTLVVEKLKNIKNKMKAKRRLAKNVRRFVSRWNYRYVLGRIQALSEENRVSFRSVPAYYTSIDCPSCGLRDKRNRVNQSDFRCVSCGYTNNADYVGAMNVLNRFLTGAYGPGCKTDNILLYFQ